MKNYIKRKEQQDSMKKFIFTESQIKKIVAATLNEQQNFADDEKMAIDAGTKAFLDAKRIQGANLSDRIRKYQLSIPNCKPTGHMLDCKGMLPEQDRKLWQSLINKNKPLFDKALDWFNVMLGLGPGSGY